MLEIYNSFSKQKEVFNPIEPGKVKMYVCGITVYDYCHVGHARFLIVFDVVARYLRFLGYEVTYVRNITDIDDKIIVRAQENAEPIDELTSRFIKAMQEDCELLAVLPPDQEPRATRSMNEIIAMIQSLEQKGFTYSIDSGDVYYDVKKFKAYGRLSGRKLEDQIAGKRIEVDSQKKNAEDFVLWKASKADEPSWDSPWGPGRPGWHIECSAMSTQCLGEHFDIHGGGMDLKFPHHENEIAQTEASTGKKSVNYWMHNGFVQVDKQKMGKSEGNFFTVREVLKEYQPEEIRYFILNSHYRSPLNYSNENLDKARAALTTLYTALRGVELVEIDAAAINNEFNRRFTRAMDDDFNTADALAVIFDLGHALNRAKTASDSQVGKLAAQLKYLSSFLGLVQNDPEMYLKGGENSLDTNESGAIEELINQRLAARKNRDFALADQIRDDLRNRGIVLEDKADTTIWRKA